MLLLLVCSSSISMYGCVARIGVSEGQVAWHIVWALHATHAQTQCSKGKIHKMDAIKHKWVRERTQNGGCIQTYTHLDFFSPFTWPVIAFFASLRHVGWD